MSRSQPPMVATWLLYRFGAGSRHESLVGDVLEKYARGRSVAWCWRQVLVAIMVTVNRDIRDHTLLAIRALATGWALYVVLSFPVTWLTGVSTTFINTWLWTFQHASSWTVFWADRVASTCVIGLACAVSGWIVARLHSAHAATMVCLYAASVLVFEYGFMSWMFWRYGHPPMPWTMLVLPAILILSRPLGILIGGLSVRPDPNSFVPRSV